MPEELKDFNTNQEVLPTDDELLFGQVEKDQEEDDSIEQLDVLHLEDEDIREIEEETAKESPKIINYTQPSIKSFFT